MQDKINEFRKKLILDSASSYFRECGYEKTQIDKIARELSVGVGTIYSLFGSKEGLFLAWVFSILEEAYGVIKKEIELEPDLIKKIKIFVDYKLNYYETNKTTIVDYMQNNQFFLKNTARRKENPMVKVYKLLSEILEELCVENNMKRDDYLILAYILDGIVNAYIERFSQEPVSLNTKSDEILRTFLNSVGLVQVYV